MKKEGFADKQITLTSSLSGWYFGNLLLGGLIGMVAVDPLTGAMFVFPETTTGRLDATAAQTSRADGSLTIVSTDRLTPEQMKSARLFDVATQLH